VDVSTGSCTSLYFLHTSAHNRDLHSFPTRRSSDLPWKNADPRLDTLSETIQEIAAAAERQKESRPATFDRIWKAAHAAAGWPAPQIKISPSQAGVPFLSEPWYCCAEPTRDQLVSIGAQKPPVNKAVGGADGFV